MNRKIMYSYIYLISEFSPNNNLVIGANRLNQQVMQSILNESRKTRCTCFYQNWLRSTRETAELLFNQANVQRRFIPHNCIEEHSRNLTLKLKKSIEMIEQSPHQDGVSSHSLLLLWIELKVCIIGYGMKSPTTFFLFFFSPNLTQLSRWRQKYVFLLFAL